MATVHGLYHLRRVMHACYGAELHCRAALRENEVISLEDVFGFFALDGTYLSDFEIDMMWLFLSSLSLTPSTRSSILSS